MKIGKLSDDELKEYIFKYITSSRKDVLKNSEIGMDTAVVDLNGDLAVLSTDPITGASKDIGKLAVNISCNDVASEGAEPIGILLSVLVPPNSEIEDLKKIIIEADNECQKIGLDIIGGHTEVTDAVNKIIVTSTVIGKVPKESVLSKSTIKENDVVCISKYIGLEGTFIIAKEKEEHLSFQDNEWEIVEKMGNSISIVDEALLAKKYRVKFMHDITEGGVYGALWESSEFLKKQIVIKKDLIPIHKITKQICSIFKIDPYRLISSGSVIMVFDKNDFELYQNECNKKNIKVTKIGYIEKGANVKIVSDDIEIIKNTTVDELYKVI